MEKIEQAKQLLDRLDNGQRKENQDRLRKVLIRQYLEETRMLIEMRN